MSITDMIRCSQPTGACLGAIQTYTVHHFLAHIVLIRSNTPLALLYVSTTIMGMNLDTCEQEVTGLTKSVDFFPIKFISDTEIVG